MKTVKCVGGCGTELKLRPERTAAKLKKGARKLRPVKQPIVCGRPACLAVLMRWRKS